MSLLEAILEEARTAVKQLENRARNLIKEKKQKRWGLYDSTVVLLPGFFIGNSSFIGLQDFLEENKFNAYNRDYPYWKHPKEIEDWLIPELELLAKVVGSKLSLVGHSQGGLIACGISQRCPGLIDKSISLGSPFLGTYAAALGYPIPGARQIMPGSEYILEINSRDFPSEVDFYSVYTPYDEAVIPQRNAIIPYSQSNIHNIELTNVCHLGLIGEKVHPLVVELLQKD